MGNKLYVGNLTYNVNESDLEALFSQFGTVQSAQVIVDRDTNRSKGFAFERFVSRSTMIWALCTVPTWENNASRSDSLTL